ncbi:hypothetical protein [Streptomyces sp. NPDC001436]
MDGDDIGKWLQQQKQPPTWARLLPEQQARLTGLVVEPVQAPPPGPTASRAGRTEQGAAGIPLRIEELDHRSDQREGIHHVVPGVLGAGDSVCTGVTAEGTRDWVTVPGEELGVRVPDRGEDAGDLELVIVQRELDAFGLEAVTS